MKVYVGVLAITGKITIGVTTQMFTASGTLYGSMRGLITALQDLTKRANYANEYVNFMDYPAAIHKGSRHVKKGPHTFELKTSDSPIPIQKYQFYRGGI